MAKDDKYEREIAAKVADLKAKATPDAIQRMTALFQAEVARRDAAKKSAARPTASAAPPAGTPGKTPGSHALEVLKRWREKR
jgi:hypothetical protein